VRLRSQDRRPAVPGERIWVTAIVCSAWQFRRFPARDSRCRTWSPEDTPVGAVPL